MGIIHFRLTACLLACLALSACGNARPEVRLPDELHAAQDWSRDLPSVYGGMMVCLGAHPSQPAFAAEAVKAAEGHVLTYAVGRDGLTFECLAGEDRNFPEQWARTERSSFSGPAFIPATMAKPEDACGRAVPVESDDGDTLGWISFGMGCAAADKHVSFMTPLPPVVAYQTRIEAWRKGPRIPLITTYKTKVF